MLSLLPTKALLKLVNGLCIALLSQGAIAQKTALPLFDGHLHYSHDAADLVPADKAIAILRSAGIKFAVVSSSNDEGTQKLRQLAPDMILPSLRPYRSRADTSTWLNNAAIIPYMKERLARYRYVAIGEFHVSGDDARLPIMKATVELARQHQLILHAHADAKAVEILFELDPGATVLWAHSGFDQPDTIAAMLKKHPRLYADLAFRSDYANAGELDPGWRKLFELFPDRFMAGTDTYTPERWSYIGEYAQWVRQWLAKLPQPLQERLAYKNGEALFAPYQARLGAAKPIASKPCAPEDGWIALRSDQGQEIFVKPNTVPALSKMFSARVSSCGSSTLRLRALDVVMPEHRHGMNYKPEFSQVNASTIDAKGLLLHMPGRWQWQVDAQLGEADARRFVAGLELK